MSEQRDEIKLPTWEILAAIVGYFTSVESVISLIGKTFIGYDEIPRCAKIIISMSYLLILIVISWVTLFQIHRPKLITDENKFDFKNNELKDILNRIIIIEAFKTLGLSLTRGKYLDFFDVNLFDFFQRPNNWISRDDLFKFIRRFMFSDFTYQYEFSNNFQFIEFKKNNFRLREVWFK